MSLLKRTTRIVRSKVNVIVSKFEDPIQQLEQAESEMEDQLINVTTNLKKLKTEKKRLENKADKLETEVEKHNQQARKAMEQGREDLAREALGRKKSKQAEVKELRKHVNSLEQTEVELGDKRDQLKTKLQKFRMDKQLKETQYETAKARKSVSETLNGEIGNGGNAEEVMERMDAEIEDNRAKADALEEMNEDSIEDELEELTTEAGVENELEELREEFGTTDSDDGSEIDVIEDELEVETVDTDSIENEQLEMELD